MFTGLVEELGRIYNIQTSSRSARIRIQAEEVLAGVKLGDSIAVNGVCLTVTEFNAQTFTVDVMAETLRRSNLGRLTAGDSVNLERALRLGDRLGGHLVSGHIDGIGMITREEKVDIARVLVISAPPTIIRYTLEKGSIAIDGISLTIVETHKDGFSVSLIPHTAGLTTLGFKRIGDTVNLEADLIGKYVEKLCGVNSPERGADSGSGLTQDFLLDNGFF